MYRFLLASALGTFLEFFDLTLYSFCAAIIGKHFFPTIDPLIGTLSAWGIFAVSYFMRPLGGIFFGYIADVKSSKLAMILSMSLMSIATLGIGLLPDYNTLGIFAPITLLLLRIIQSVAVSPEYNLPSVFIKNNQWFANRFGLVSSISACVTGLGIMSASWIMSKVLSGYDLQEIPQHVWRLPFIISGLLVGTVGLYLRLTLDTSLVAKPQKLLPLKMIFNYQPKDFLKSVFISGYIGCISYALFGFLVHQLQVVHGMQLGAALSILSQGCLLPAIFSCIAGYMSDSYRRDKLMLAGAITILIGSWYLFSNIGALPVTKIVLLTCIMLAALGFFAGSFPGYTAELFNKEYRYTGAFLSYNLGMSWIGGISPLLLIKLSAESSELPVYVLIFYSLAVIMLLLNPLTKTTELKFAHESGTFKG